VVTIEEDPGGGFRLVDRNAADGRVRWSVPGFPQSAMAAGLVFVQTPAAAALDAYRLSTGALAWQSPYPGVGYLAQLAIVPGGSPLGWLTGGRQARTGPGAVHLDRGLDAADGGCPRQRGRPVRSGEGHAARRRRRGQLPH
jgi:hypothetical protein